MSQAEKWIPERLMTLKGMSSVVKVEAYPPHSHSKGSCIRADLTQVVATCANGEVCQYGFQSAYIDSYLRMRVSGYNPRFEEVAAWENAPQQ